jgi:ribonuclease-3 family protein
VDYKNMNVLTLAYIGDGVYEMAIREFLVKQGITKVNSLQKEAIKYVSAVGQAKFLDDMIGDNLLSDEELAIIYRARNHKGNSHPKNTDIITYKHATGLEALIGYLYLIGDNKRIKEIMSYILNQKES